MSPINILKTGIQYITSLLMSNKDVCSSVISSVCFRLKSATRIDLIIFIDKTDKISIISLKRISDIHPHYTSH